MAELALDSSKLSSNDSAVGSPKENRASRHFASEENDVVAADDHPMPQLAFAKSEYELWGNARKGAYRLAIHPAFEAAMTTVILLNIVVMVMDADAAASCEGDCKAPFAPSEALAVIDTIFLVLYTLDLVLHIFVEQARYHWSRWNLLDFCIVFAGYIELVLDSLEGVGDASWLSFVRMMRLIRIMRVVKIFKRIKELYKLIVGFMTTLRAIFWGFVMLLSLSLIFSIVTVQLVQNYRHLGVSAEDDWCSYAFSSTLRTVLFYFQTLIAADAWGDCALPIIREEWKFFFLFSAAFICVNLGFMNLILSVIVDDSQTQHEMHAKERAEQDKLREHEDIVVFYESMKRIDADKSGSLSLRELLDGYDHDDEVRAKLLHLGLDQTDLTSLFHAMDIHGSDSVSYGDMIEVIHRSATQDARIEFMFIKLELRKLVRNFENRMANMESVLITNASKEVAPSFRNFGFVHNPLSCRVKPVEPPPEPNVPPSSCVIPSAKTELPGNDQGTSAKQGFEILSVAPDFESVASSVAALEEELRSLGVDLGGRLQALANEAEKHRGVVAKHATMLGAKLKSLSSAS